MITGSREMYKVLWNKAKKTGKLELHPERLKNLLGEEFPPEVWIVDQLIPDESVTILSGSPGSFKTWLYMELAVKVASGNVAFGHFQTKKTGVMVIDEESGRRRLQKRLKQLGATDDMPIHFTSRIGYKMNQLYADAIADKAFELGVGLIIFDSFTRFNGGDENTSGDMATLMDYYRQLADDGFAVLILHHNRKEMAGQHTNPAQAMRGSSDILASTDCHIAVSRTGQSEFVRLTQTKNRDEWETLPFELRFRENASEFEYVGAAKSSAERHREQLDEVLAIANSFPGSSKRQLVTEIKSQGFKAGEKKIGELLDELAAGGEIDQKPGERNSYLYYPIADGSAAKTQ